MPQTRLPQPAVGSVRVAEPLLWVTSRREPCAEQMGR